MSFLVGNIGSPNLFHPFISQLTLLISPLWFVKSYVRSVEFGSFPMRILLVFFVGPIFSVEVSSGKRIPPKTTIYISFQVSVCGLGSWFDAIREVLISPKSDQEGNKLMFLSEWREFPLAPCFVGGVLMTARVSMLLKSHASLTCFRACFLPGRAKDLSALRYFICDTYSFFV